MECSSPLDITGVIRNTVIDPPPTWLLLGTPLCSQCRVERSCLSLASDSKGRVFRLGQAPHPRCPAGQDYQDYLEGAPCSSHGEKDPHAGVAGSEPEGDLIIDETKELIPIDMDGRGSSDCKIIEVITSPPVTTLVKKSKAKQKPIDQAMKLAAVKVGTARVDDILGSHLLF